MPKPESCRYMKSHEWAYSESGVVQVGVSDHAQKEISDVVFVELPKKGRQVKQGESVAIVESVKAAFDIYAPVSGEIVGANDAVTKDPALVNRSAQGDGWLFQIKPAKPAELDGLMDWRTYQDFVKSAAAHDH